MVSRWLPDRAVWWPVEAVALLWWSVGREEVECSGVPVVERWGIEPGGEEGGRGREGGGVGGWYGLAGRGVLFCMYHWLVRGGTQLAPAKSSAAWESSDGGMQRPACKTSER